MWEVKMQDRPFITIINPIRNTQRTLAKCLESLLNLDYPKERIEYIFADGGSSDSTVQIIKDWQKRYPQIKLVEVANCKSPGQARNAALAVARGDYILFTDGDCYVRKDWANNILEPFFNDPHIGMVGGEIFTMHTDHNDTEIYCEQTKFLSVAGRCRLTKEGYYPAIEKNLPHEVNGNIDSPFFATANAAVSKAAVDSIGREFWHEITNEDVDFSIRIIKKGYRLYYKPDAVVEHMHRMSLNDYAKQLFGYGFGHSLPVRAHAKKIFEICLQYFGYLYIPLPFFIKGMLYIGDFHLLHLFGVLFLAQLVVAFFAHNLFNTLLVIWGALFIFFTLKYFWPVLRIKPRSYFLTWAKIRYFSNWALMRGGFKGMRTWKVFYLESSW